MCLPDSSRGGYPAALVARRRAEKPAPAAHPHRRREDRAVRRTPCGHRELPSYTPSRGAMHCLRDTLSHGGRGVTIPVRSQHTNVCSLFHFVLEIKPATSWSTPPGATSKIPLGRLEMRAHYVPYWER